MRDFHHHLPLSNHPLMEATSTLLNHIILKMDKTNFCLCLFLKFYYLINEFNQSLGVKNMIIQGSDLFFLYIKLNFTPTQVKCVVL